MSSKRNKYAKLIQKRIYTKERKVKEKMKDSTKITMGCGAAMIGIICIIGSMFLTPLFLMLTWNFGVCALFPTLPVMGYWVAFLVNWFLGTIGAKFTSNSISATLDKINFRCLLLRLLELWH